MEAIWNDFDLKKPPFLTLPSTKTSFVVNLHGIIETFFSKYTKYEEEFTETAALLGRLMARRKNSFNKMKGFKDICKINSALCRLLRLDFKRDLESFRSTLPDVAYDEDTLIHLPTRDTFDFLLTRLVAFCELYKRIVECCVQAAEYFTGQLKIHFFFETCTLLLAVLAKIHNLSIKQGNLAVHFYNNLQQYREKLPSNEKSKFQAISNSLPSQIETIKKVIMAREEYETKSDVKGIQDDASTMKDILEQECHDAPKTPVKAKKLKKADLGKIIERSPAASEKVTKFNIDNLQTVQDVQKFITSETKERSQNTKSCITKNVQSHEWAGATKLFERKIIAGEEKKAINIFKKFISSKL
ncbi:uncharacterized protein LOC133326934 [Musca vetustissima]|uniref:uncharacterized protein LOC133326934 n=1 Tax=Musca vetustissima TaxID=27455 RepID=UPI002AB5F04E|nr:uncharacterized protein LOC133326934 [Musca vetustissima]